MRVLTQRRTLALLRADISCLNWLRALWFLGVLWCETGVYRLAVFRCGWPDRRLSLSSAKPTHVLVLTDPQVRPAGSRKHSCFFPGLHDWFYHAGLRRNWRYAVRLNPDVVVFLGDMLASARKIKDDDEYVENYLKFRRIFSLNKRVPVFHAPGNEDIGLNLIDADARVTQRHYMSHFGPLNSEVSIANHSFVFINAPGLVEEDYHRARRVGSKEYHDYDAPPGGAVDFLRDLAHEREGQDEMLTVLFTHIPLSRPDGVSCGPLRERGTVRRGAGPGYQNMYGKRTSEFLLETLRPMLVLSGDDRDYCEYSHSIPGPEPDTTIPVREVTVKSFSPDRAIRYPGFHLLSLIPPHTTLPGDTSATTLADSPCFLPSQGRIYNAIYLPFAIITILILWARRIREYRERPRPSPLPSYHFDERVLTGPALRHKLNDEKTAKRPWRKPSMTNSVPISASGASRPHLLRSVIRSIADRIAWKDIGPSDISTGRLRMWHICYRLIRLTTLDFVKAMLPSLVLWSVVMWATLR